MCIEKSIREQPKQQLQHEYEYFFKCVISIKRFSHFHVVVAVVVFLRTYYTFC